MITYGNGRIVLPIKNGVKRHLRNSFKSKQSGSVSPDSDSCDSVPTTKVDGTNDLSSALTTCTSPSTEYLTPFANELPWHQFPPTADDDNGGAEWVCVDKVKDLNPNPLSLYDGYVFGSVPSGDEVEAAVASLQGLLDQSTSADGKKESESEPEYDSDSSSDLEEGTNDESSTADSSSVTPVGSISDWIEPSMQLCYSNKSGMLQQKHGYAVVLEALYMLQQEPMVKKMVASLSTDTAVWEAMLNNEVVKDMRESLSKAVVISSVSSKAPGSESKSANIVSSFMHNLKAKIEGLINTLKMLMISLIHCEKSDQATGESSDATREGRLLRVSFTLTMIVFLIVVLKRMNK